MCVRLHEYNQMFLGCTVRSCGIQHFKKRSTCASKGFCVGDCVASQIEHTCRAFNGLVPGYGPTFSVGWPDNNYVALGSKCITNTSKTNPWTLFDPVMTAAFGELPSVTLVDGCTAYEQGSDPMAVYTYSRHRSYEQDGHMVRPRDVVGGGGGREMGSACRAAHLILRCPCAQVRGRFKRNPWLDDDEVTARRGVLPESVGTAA